ncbi:MAG: MgtC/SapB family protein [Candidatus Jorgensenbacteria bacterium]|nr:MgtC/SapB family protein [Candidatus Jorgensenbacteria bacterium]
MLSLEDMLIRLGVAVLLGAAIGLEREFAGKDAGIRTDVVVSAGAAIFSIIAITLPYIVSLSQSHLAEVIAGNSGFLAVIANIVVGIGFLGGGIIVRQGIHVRSLTTAATVWLVAAVGVLCGIGLLTFAAFATAGLVVILIVLRRIDMVSSEPSGNGKNRTAKGK